MFANKRKTKKTNVTRPESLSLKSGASRLVEGKELPRYAKAEKEGSIGKFDPIEDSFYYTITTTIPLMAKSRVGWDFNPIKDPDNKLFSQVHDIIFEEYELAHQKTLGRIFDLLGTANHSFFIDEQLANEISEQTKYPIVPLNMTHYVTEQFRQVPVIADFAYQKAWRKAVERTGVDVWHSRFGRHKEIPRENVKARTNASLL